MDPNELFRKLKVDKDLVTGFFIYFSRFEYALKRMNSYAAGDENGVKANWDKFGLEHDSLFIPERTSILRSAVNYLQTNQPRKQIKNITLGWKTIEHQNTPRLQQILCSVRRVRHNLFHGGKFPEGPVEEPGRDTMLLQSCITILNECLRLNNELRTIFNASE